MASAPDIDGTISISKIILKLGKHARPFREARLTVNERNQTIEWQGVSKSMLEAAFAPPLVLSPGDQLNISVCRSYGSATSKLLAQTQPIRIPASHLTAAIPQSDRADTREWHQTFDREEIIIQLSSATSSQVQLSPGSPDPPPTSEIGNALASGELVPTTAEIERKCPQFRILVAGKTGAGKSSLIDAVFGVNHGKVAHHKPGDADLNFEFKSEANPRLIVHDSRGFEPAEDKNLEDLLAFIKARDAKPLVKDRLHAIWLCFQVPDAGGRVMETGVERILQMKKDGELGNVPIIFVLTKYDDLVDQERRNLARAPAGTRISRENRDKKAKQNAEAIVIRDCIEHIKEKIDTNVMYKIVSTKKSYESTILDLVQLTFDLVKEKGEIPATVATAIAQKVNPNVKIEGYIIVGRKNYWACLGASTIPGKKIQDYLKVVHTEILDVWALNDPDELLKSQNFRGKMSKLVHDEERTHPNAALRTGIPIVGAVGGAVGLLAGPVGPIAGPVAGAVVGVVLLAKWARDVYQYSQNTLARLMAYIIDLTLVMEMLFGLLTDSNAKVTVRAIQYAYRAYGESSRSSRAHDRILQYTETVATLKPGAADQTVAQMTEIIAKHRVDSEEMKRHKDQFQKLSTSANEVDEKWEA